MADEDYAMAGIQNDFLTNVNQTLNQLLTKKTKRGKKKKDIRLISRQKTITYKPSQREAVVRKLYRKKVQNLTEATAVLVNEGLELKEGDAKNYFTIAQIKSDNVRVPFPKALLKRDILLNVLTNTKFMLKGVTTDLLYWAKVAYSVLSDQGRKCMELKKVTVVSNRAFVFTDTRQMKEKYINDFEAAISCPFFDRENSKLSKDETIKGYTMSKAGGDFTYMGSKYHTWTMKERPGEDVYVKDGEFNKPDQFVEKLINADWYYTEGDLLKSGVKVIDRKANAYFFDKSFEPTTFCPVTLNFNIPKDKDDKEYSDTVECTVMFTYRINPDDYLNVSIQEKGISLFDNSLTFKNLDQMLQMFEIFSLALGFDEEKSLIVKLVKDFQRNKAAYTALKKHYTDFEKIVLTYLDSFTNRISVDKMTALLKLVNQYIVDEDMLTANTVELEKIKEVISFDDKATKLMVNFLSGKTRNAVAYMKTVLEKITLPNVDNTGLEADIRSCAMLCFGFLLTGDTPVIPEIRSPSIFLGNTLGGYNVTVLEENVQTFLERQKVLAQTNKEIEKKIKEVAANAADNERNKLLNEIAKKINDPAAIKDMLIDKGYIDKMDIEEEDIPTQRSTKKKK